MYFNFKVFRETFPRAHLIVLLVMFTVVLVFGIPALIGMVCGIIQTIKEMK